VGFGIGVVALAVTVFVFVSYTELQRYAKGQSVQAQLSLR